MTATMTETPENPAEISAPPPLATGKPAKPAKKEDNFFVFLIKLILVVGIFRSFFFSPFNIPSESMQPRLIDGDYLLAAKWPYGFTKYSLPFSLPLIPGRILGSHPARGDVAIFKAPPGNQVDCISHLAESLVRTRSTGLAFASCPLARARPSAQLLAFRSALLCGAG